MGTSVPGIILFCVKHADVESYVGYDWQSPLLVV